MSEQNNIIDPIIRPSIPSQEPEMSLEIIRSVSSPFFISKIISTISYYYYDFWEISGDPRVSEYAIMRGGPWFIFALVAAYLYFIKVLGPEVMKNREPFKLHGPIRAYNIFMASLNAWGLYQGLNTLRFVSDVLGCEGINRHDRSPNEMYKIYLGWIFIMSRILEFADTIFFVLRKKYRQISTLHVFHHSSVPIVVWFGLKFAPGSSNIVYPMVNSFIHIIMYSYYAMSTFPRLVPYLWWKKYLTQLQLAQFIILIVHPMRTLFIPQCEFPKVFLYLTMGMCSVFFVQFSSFYLQSYQKRKENARILVNGKIHTENYTHNKQG